MLENYSDVLTVKDVCEILHVCKTTAYKMLNSGEIPNRKYGNTHYISKEQFIQWLHGENPKVA